MATAKKGKYPRARRDLLLIFDEINEEYFGGMVCAGIAFRHMACKGNETTWGACQEDERFIKVNMFLDDPEVPEWVLRYIVYHEMLHLFFPDYAKRGDPDHPPRFRTIEKRHPDYQRFLAWDAEESAPILKKWEKLKNGKG